MPIELTSRTVELPPAVVPVENIASLADVAGAAMIAADARRASLVRTESSRDLCSRLRFHVDELQLALARSDADNAARTNAVVIARVLVEEVLEARFQQRDVERERFAERLGIERTKFLMSSRADALVALRDQLATQPRRSHAAIAARDIALDRLAAFSQRTQVESTRTLELATRRLFSDLESSLGDLGETIPAAAMAGVQRLRGWRRELGFASTPGVLAQLADRIGLRRTEVVARDELVRMLDAGSLRVIESALADVDDARSAIELRFCELIDAALETVRVAARFAAEARGDGPDGIAVARQRVATWSRQVDELRAQLAR